MKRQPAARGFVLLYGIAILAVILLAVMLLARAASSRMQAQHTSSQRAAAVLNAESALEQARAALADGKLAPGSSLSVNGLSVACVSLKNGVELDTLVPLLTPTSVLASAPKTPQQAVRVRWTLTPSSAGATPGTGAAPIWSVAAWHSQNETTR